MIKIILSNLLHNFRNKIKLKNKFIFIYLLKYNSFSNFCNKINLNNF